MKFSRMLAPVLAAALIASATPAQAAAPQQLKIAGLSVAAWIPDAAAPGPWPVIVFSHGFHGCSTQSKFLTGALADAGYAVFAPNHKDASCGKRGSMFGRPEVPFRDAADWTESTYADRAKDIKALLDALQADPKYGKAPFDWQHVALAGHSLGGYTALELGGAWPSRRESRVKAVLALSPYSMPFVDQHTLHGLGAPVMYQGGTRDIGITPFVKKAGGAYDQSPVPKYFVEFDGAGHLAWSDLRDTDHDGIVEYARAFLDRYLKDKPFPAQLTKPHGGVIEIEIAN